MFAGARQFIRVTRRSKLLTALASCSEKYLRAWYNEGYFDFSKNGEGFALKTFAAWNGAKPVWIWDVGAHKGQWASAAHRLVPSAYVTSFEILKPLAEQIVPEQWLKVENIGLSDQVGAIDISWNKSHSSTSSIAPRTGSRWFSNSDIEIVRCSVTTLDVYAEHHTPPTLLKIDTEGHDACVLAGGEKLLSSPDAPAMIQFEYGDTWLPAGKTLLQVQNKLESLGYSVGRLYPNYVHFKKYEYTDDHFRMGNMIAVKDDRLKRMLL